MAIKNNNELLRDALGKGKCDVINAAVTGKDYYALHFITDTVVTAITAPNLTNADRLQVTIPAGTVLFTNVTELTVSSGLVIGYTN